MKQRLHILTLGVNDLPTAMKFYQALGWSTEGIVGTEFEHGAVAFFELANGLKLGLYERKNLAWDSRADLQPPSPTEFSIGHLVNSEQEVDDALEKARAAGARITKPGEKAFWGGYHGYFQDPDGHLWEIAYNPAWQIGEY